VRPHHKPSWRVRPRTEGTATVPEDRSTIGEHSPLCRSPASLLLLSPVPTHRHPEPPRVLEPQRTADTTHLPRTAAIHDGSVHREDRPAIRDGAAALPRGGRQPPAPGRAARLARLLLVTRLRHLPTHSRPAPALAFSRLETHTFPFPHPSSGQAKAPLLPAMTQTALPNPASVTAPPGAPNGTAQLVWLGGPVAAIPCQRPRWFPRSRSVTVSYRGPRPRQAWHVRLSAPGYRGYAAYRAATSVFCGAPTWTEISCARGSRPYSRPKAVWALTQRLICPRRSPVMDLRQVGVNGMRAGELLAAQSAPVPAGVAVGQRTPPRRSVHHPREVVVGLRAPASAAVLRHAGVYGRPCDRVAGDGGDGHLTGPEPQRRRLSWPLILVMRDRSFLRARWPGMGCEIGAGAACESEALVVQRDPQRRNRDVPAEPDIT
jgi:hypothetical protein